MIDPLSAPYIQYLIIMEEVTSSFFSLCPCSLAGNKEYNYYHLFDEIIVLIELKWMNRTITIDLEKKLIFELNDEFPDSNIL
ncbi:LOW QUALITY PROTEIN: hypothetical protein HZS_2878 [Henneguya salminicola]|nr:LOW QUALITY PROTEIN: hypothetical protein HZS_2878 [Henneguya salminicola]